jgi:hypothetical protein
MGKGLRIPIGEFLDRYGQITLGPESGLPVCWLDFEKVQRRRGGDERSPPCPFLALEEVCFASEASTIWSGKPQRAFLSYALPPKA